MQHTSDHPEDGRNGVQVKRQLSNVAMKYTRRRSATAYPPLDTDPAPNFTTLPGIETLLPNAPAELSSPEPAAPDPDPPVLHRGFSSTKSSNKHPESDAVSLAIPTLSRQKRRPLCPSLLRRCVLLPNGHFRKVWDALQAVILVYVAVIVPVRIGMELPARGGWYVLEFAMDVYFWLDLAFNFMTGYEDVDVADGYITEHCKITKNYLQGWFTVDLLACLPIDLIVRATDGSFMCSLKGSCDMNNAGSTGQIFRFFKILRLIRFVKLLRLFRMSRLFERYQDDLFPLIRFVPLMRNIFIIVFSAHIVGCLLYFFSDPSFRSANERKLVEEGVLEPWLEKPAMRDAAVSEKYIATLYWAFTTLTTVGYGDISATTQSERMLATFSMGGGVFLFSFVVGSVTSLIQSLHRAKEVHTRKMEAVYAFMRDNKVSKHLRSPVLAYLRRQRPAEYNIKTLLMDIPYELRAPILRYLYEELMHDKVQFFDNCDSVFIAEVCARLQPSTYAKNSTIFNRGEIGREMYILAAGTCIAVDLNGLELEYYKPGSCFGEGAIFGDYRRIETIKCKTRCTVCVLKVEDMEELLTSFQHIIDRLGANYFERRERREREDEDAAARSTFGDDRHTATTGWDALTQPDTVHSRDSEGSETDDGGLNSPRTNNLNSSTHTNPSPTIPPSGSVTNTSRKRHVQIANMPDTPSSPIPPPYGSVDRTGSSHNEFEQAQLTGDGDTESVALSASGSLKDLHTEMKRHSITAKFAKTLMKRKQSVASDDVNRTATPEGERSRSPGTKSPRASIHFDHHPSISHATALLQQNQTGHILQAVKKLERLLMKTNTRIDELKDEIGLMHADHREQFRNLQDDLAALGHNGP